MVELGRRDGSVVVVNADLAGTCRNRSFEEQFPERSFNVGIAEQNLVAFAAGLSCEGIKPYAFSMAPFLTMRACEQVRTDVAYGNRNVKLIGVYAGVSGGISGATHWGIEDIGIMTSIPGIEVYEVSDACQAIKLMDYTLEHHAPMYIRCSVEPTENIYDKNVSVKSGGSITIKEGKDGAILCSGVSVQYSIEAAHMMKREFGKNICVIDMYSIKPIDRDAVIHAAMTGNIVVVQDHNVFGGLGSMVEKIIAEENLQTNYKVLGIPDKFVPMAHAPYLYNTFGMNARGIKEAMLEQMEL